MCIWQLIQLRTQFFFTFPFSSTSTWSSLLSFPKCRYLSHTNTIIPKVHKAKSRAASVTLTSDLRCSHATQRKNNNLSFVYAYVVCFCCSFLTLILIAWYWFRTRHRSVFVIAVTNGTLRNIQCVVSALVSYIM